MLKSADKRRLSVVLIVAMALSGCTPWPCIDDTLAESRSPDAAIAASVVRRNCGSTTEVVAYFYVQHNADGKSHELFRMTGPFTARFEWKQPRLLHVVVADYLGDKTGSWTETIEKQIAAHRDIRYRDLRVLVGSTRQFGSPSEPR